MITFNTECNDKEEGGSENLNYVIHGWFLSKQERKGEIGTSWFSNLKIKKEENIRDDLIFKVFGTCLRFLQHVKT